MRESSERTPDRKVVSLRLRHALMHAVEERRSGRAPATLNWGSRAFVTAMEGRRELGHAPAERPRLGTIVLAMVLCAVVVVGVAAWPSLVADALRATRTRVTTTSTAGTAAGTTSTAGTAAGTAGATATPAPVTFAHEQVAGPGAGGGFVASGQWSALAQGGYPGFRGATEWTTSTGSTATWSLGPTSGGSRWDQVRVQVWVPGQHAGAWVRYTITATDGGQSQSRAFDVAQQTASGWLTLPATFAVGTPTQRTGSIQVQMAYLRPYTGPAADATCTGGGVCSAMAAGQVAFQWS